MNTQETIDNSDPFLLCQLYCTIIRIQRMHKSMQHVHRYVYSYIGSICKICENYNSPKKLSIVFVSTIRVCVLWGQSVEYVLVCVPYKR